MIRQNALMQAKGDVGKGHGVDKQLEAVQAADIMSCQVLTWCSLHQRRPLEFYEVFKSSLIVLVLKDACVSRL